MGILTCVQCAWRWGDDRIKRRRGVLLCMWGWLRWVNKNHSALQKSQSCEHSSGETPQICLICAWNLTQNILVKLAHHPRSKKKESMAPPGIFQPGFVRICQWTPCSQNEGFTTTSVVCVEGQQCYKHAAFEHFEWFHKKLGTIDYEKKQWMSGFSEHLTI